ncbi:LysR family transcriptional regulator [Vibrio coralliilyticus]|uniref:LysR substrate-binding domain-containing protein n=1 Tax=Vibrio TaxID=662 RepID=UPI0005005149|nr:MULTISPECIES: LysR substrate-binding domain-containing protein [Vibrio]KFI12582.1 transcriptional regulator [Vibrio sp. B183]NOI17189.1 LysR family transcriptional regulator [Vibrio coralliilyticus]NRF23489.1 LysR family transcriptional regulator [Vibrio coralliilyticus]NRF77800.1 LysR family transcriptional regulator [Vibrio coralliilyticus]
MRFIPPLNALKAFESAARLQSLTRAAEELNVTRAAVSQQVKQLETYLDATLFERKGAKLLLTQDAQYYLPLLTQMFESLSVGTEQLFQRKQRQMLKLSIAQSFCFQWLIPRLEDFRREYPNVELKVFTTSNAYPNGSKVADIEIINGPLPQDEVKAKVLTEESWVLVAAPRLVKSKLLNTLEELAGCEKIATTGYKEDWQFWFDYHQYVGVVKEPSLQFDHSLLSIEAAVAGLGVLLVKELLVEEQLIQGSLVKVGDKKVPSRDGHYLLQRDVHNPLATQFSEWITKSLDYSHGGAI